MLLGAMLPLLPAPLPATCADCYMEFLPCDSQEPEDAGAATVRCLACLVWHEARRASRCEQMHRGMVHSGGGVILSQPLSWNPGAAWRRWRWPSGTSWWSAVSWACSGKRMRRAAAATPGAAERGMPAHTHALASAEPHSRAAARPHLPPCRPGGLPACRYRMGDVLLCVGHLGKTPKAGPAEPVRRCRSSSGAWAPVLCGACPALLACLWNRR